MNSEILITLIISLICGGAAALLIDKYLYILEKKRAQSEAKDILDKAQDAAELLEMDQKEYLLEIEEDLWGKAEPEHLKLEEKIEELEELIQEKKSNLDENIKEVKKKAEPKFQNFKSKEDLFQKLSSRVESLKKNSIDFKNKIIDSLSEKLKSSKEEFKKELIQNLTQEAEISANKRATYFLNEVTLSSESLAKRILATAIDRFARPYCSEKGLGLIEFSDDYQRKNLIDKDNKNLNLIQELTGCDLIIDNETNYINIAGFDPVRRELTRRTLEKLLKEKKSIYPDLIKRRYEDAKRELFKQIKNDGDMLAKELGLFNLHPEIRQMMGSLRYRYSFTQNQYFHCGEVGWLCGLLASELNLPIKQARRAGMLHDIGKSMDHAMDGGHAVIGADFIKARNESPDVVHAVRAHHFDEAPSTDLAYLVIAADAISGARPGARRNTIESYNQKVSELEAIAKSFNGVDDCYVLSGGREVRIIANGKTLNDSKALELSRSVAQRIEAEVAYPGQIKVVVVRATHSQETTKTAQH